MPRRPRIKLAGVPQHIVQRGVNREAYFFADEDYQSNLHWLKEAVNHLLSRTTSPPRIPFTSALRKMQKAGKRFIETCFAVS